MLFEIDGLSLPSFILYQGYTLKYFYVWWLIDWYWVFCLCFLSFAPECTLTLSWSLLFVLSVTSCQYRLNRDVLNEYQLTIVKNIALSPFSFRIAHSHDKRSLRSFNGQILLIHSVISVSLSLSPLLFKAIVLVNSIIHSHKLCIAYF